MDRVFLYIFGAGASCQVLPLAANFSARLADCARALKDIGPEKPKDNGPKKVWYEDHNSFLQAITWLAQESSKHYSVDTFAKKLFFRRDNNNLKKLKAVLSAYLVIEQTKNNVDQRYDSFFASILNHDSVGNLSLPDNIRILTWNYDTQLDKAYYGFCENISSVTEHITFNKNIYRVNGYCGTHPPGHIGQTFNKMLKGHNETIALQAGVEIYKEYMAGQTSVPADINFAWEDPTQNKLKNAGVNILSDVTDIVVIGYSFPYFNREIDDIIFSNFGNLFSVYLQFPAGFHAAIEERIKKFLINDVQITHVESSDLFFIPADL